METSDPTPPVPAVPLSYRPAIDVPPGNRRLIWALAGILAWHAVNSLATVLSFIATLVCATLGAPADIVGIVATAAQFLTIILSALILLVVVSSMGDFSTTGIVVLATIAIIFSLGAAAAQTIGPAMIIRHFSPQAYGRISIVRGWAYLAWTPLLPVVLLILILWLRGRSAERR